MDRYARRFPWRRARMGMPSTRVVPANNLIHSRAIAIAPESRADSAEAKDVSPLHLGILINLGQRLQLRQHLIDGSLLQRDERGVAAQIVHDLARVAQAE
jgi:hypothetical protein